MAGKADEVFGHVHKMEMGNMTTKGKARPRDGKGEVRLMIENEGFYDDLYSDYGLR